MNIYQRNLVMALIALLVCLPASASAASPPDRLELKENWLLRSSWQLEDDGQVISSHGYSPSGWHPTRVPATVLTALVKNGVYPDPRLGLNCYQIPDASEEFNQKHDLAKFSYLPEQRNPWMDPYWYRAEFEHATPLPQHRYWLNFNCINYRAEIWLNGAHIAGREQMVGMFQRFRFDVTEHLRAGRNVLAVKVWPVDHSGLPDKQLTVFGPHRGEHKEIELDVTQIETVGYDCMMTVPDRNMGICQEVFIDRTGPVDVRHPFVITELALPDTDQARLVVSAELVNSSPTGVKGTLRGRVEGTDTQFEQPIELAPRETKLVRIDRRPVLHKPRLWWPVNYGAQHLYELALEFEPEAAPPTHQRVTFGVRQVSSEMHKLDGWHGRRVKVNGKNIFCRGGYIQPELLLDWDQRRMETEIRYFADANMNLIYFEDIPNPPDIFLEFCDRYGILFGNCFYACSWVQKPGRPRDLALLERCTIDLLKRYRNHPSLIMYMAMNEGYTCEPVYAMWRRHVSALDGSRFWIPSGYFPDFIKGEPTATKPTFAHFKEDLPTGMNDLSNKSYGWQEPAQYFQWVREDRSWMFKMESGSASLPPISSLARFIPDLGTRSSDGAPFPLTATWAHHGANDYYKPYDQAIRRLHGEPESVADYCWKGHLVTADQHRAMYEAVNHRMWDITSGFTQWKINSCYPDVQWQNFDYFHKPGVSHFFIKRACRPLHVQLNPLDDVVSVINCGLAPQPDLELSARVLDISGRELWRRTRRLTLPANGFHEGFAIKGLADLAPLLFVKLELRSPTGEILADNFYWLRGRGTQDLKALQAMPLARVTGSLKLESHGTQTIAHVTIVNASDQIALMVQAALTRGEGGDEVLPVLWSDNYIGLLPGESRHLTARIQQADLNGKLPALELGGWNVQGPFSCLELNVSGKALRAGEPFAAIARISRTFLDGARIPLRVDDDLTVTRWAWARGDRVDEISFPVTLNAGRHRLTVGSSSLDVNVQ